MTFKKNSKTSVSWATVALAMLLMTVACSPAAQEARQTPSEISQITPTATPTYTPTATPTSTPTPAPTDNWTALLQKTPYPYTTPLPPANPTGLDNTYTKFDPRPGKRASCRRCAPYPPKGGVWTLHLDRGIFRVYHEDTGWLTLGSFTVSGDRIEFFNDPHCFEDVGIYTWQLEEGKLTLEVVEDNCGVYLRAQSLVAYPWESCRPPSTEAAISNHWPTPTGCPNNNDND